MKTISILIIFAIILMALKSQPETSAKPKNVQGIDVYVMSEPSRPYEVIKSGGGPSLLSCKEVINTPVNKAAKEPEAQGVIIYFPQSGKYSIIKYKD